MASDTVRDEDDFDATEQAILHARAGLRQPVADIVQRVLDEAVRIVGALEPAALDVAEKVLVGLIQSELATLAEKAGLK